MTLQIDLAGRTALVTGASAGIGAGIAESFARAGARVAITGRDATRLAAVADRIAEATGHRPVSAVGDLSTQDAVTAVYEEVLEALGGRIDILSNNAGTSVPIPIEYTEEVWDDAWDLNFTIPRRMTAAVLPGMIAAGWGRVITTTGLMEPSGLNVGSVAKGALHLLSKGLSRGLAAKGITFNCIAPGRIESDQVQRMFADPAVRQDFIDRYIPIGHFGRPEDLGHLAAFLASDFGAYITGDVIAVDGGMHWFAH